MKFVLLFFVLLMFSDSSSVYICVSRSATKYHYDKDCRGLKNCKHEVKKTTLSEAKKAGYTLCGWED